ncbi:hypothetical protein BJY24_002766 [Nocardia transvalensis]|uniref:Uncharacterized protein n=1 Tax=Nocardia transvalensis TaxID=37333 RepID=A0A7W9PD33_9NOCA|nr:hypothetical protein [Nocardia transvalensis]MBB5913899.1 hypothetical protein [Nocardia transvalensis]
MVTRSERWDSFVEHVQSAPGALTAELRRAIFKAGASDDTSALPEDLAPFAGTVARHAYRVTDEQVAALAETRSQDEVFEATVVAATGAADRRLRAALRAMGERA